MNIAELMSDTVLVGNAYAGASWAVWKVVLKSAHGLRLTTGELTRFHEVAGDRKPPQKRVRELWVVAGRRGGKDSASALIALHAALFGVSSLVRRPGEKASVLCLACDRSQAAIAHGYIKGLLRNSPLLAPLIVAEDTKSIELEGKVEIIVATNSYRAVRGRTIVVAILDECAFYRSEDSANPDDEVYNALLPSLASTGGMLIGISSPYKRSGLLWEKWRDHYGQDSDDVLVVHGPSTTFNPTLDQRIIDDALERDPQAAAAEWLAEWRTDISGFLDGDWVDFAVADREPGELPPIAGLVYYAFLDPSGGRGDAMTLAIAHRDKDGRVIVDLVRGRRAPFDPASVVAEFVEILRAYRIRQVTADRYAAEWVTSAFREHDITVKAAEKSKSEIYLESEVLFARSTISIPRDRTLLTELRNLERRTHRGGRDTVDHPAAAHDDYANSCCGAAWLASGKVGSARALLGYYANAFSGANPLALLDPLSKAYRAAAAKLSEREETEKTASPPAPVATGMVRLKVQPFQNFYCGGENPRRYGADQNGLVEVDRLHEATIRGQGGVDP